MKHEIICGDCIEIMRGVGDQTIDLIYLDPPFGDNGTDKLFTIHWDSIYDYITWIVPKLRECYRVLKDTGSMYLHCDWHANAHLRILMDEIFGENNFRNEIVWCYGSGGASKHHFSRKHDVILFYTKTNNYVFNTDDVREPYSSPEKVKYKTINGKDYLRKHPQGRIPFDWWQIPVITNTARERLGYPTQKPESLLERIIKASSIPTSIVLDPMCGCGTCMAVAHKLGRQWIGIDVSPTACKLSYQRLSKEVSQLKMDRGHSNIEKIGF